MSKLRQFQGSERECGWGWQTRLVIHLEKCGVAHTNESLDHDTPPVP